MKNLKKNNRYISKNSFFQKKKKSTKWLDAWKKFHCLSTQYVRGIGFKKSIKIVKKKKKEAGFLKFLRPQDVSSHPSCNLYFIKFLSRPNNT